MRPPIVALTARQTLFEHGQLAAGQQLAGSAPDQIAYAAVSLVGPRKRVDRIVGGLKLLS